MADISMVEVGSSVYNIKDKSARDDIQEIPRINALVEQLQQQVTELQNQINTILKFSVTSVNGKTGDIKITASSIGATPESHIAETATEEKSSHVKISSNSIDINKTAEDLPSDTAASLLATQQMGKNLQEQIDAFSDGDSGCVKSVNGISPKTGTGGQITLKANNINYKDDINVAQGIENLEKAFAEINIIANPSYDPSLVTPRDLIGLQIGELIYAIPIPESIQKDSMPEASELYVDKIFQFTGATDLEFTNGYFYKCNEIITEIPAEEGGEPTTEITYQWKPCNVQAGGGAGGGNTVIANPEGEASIDILKIQIDDTIYNIPVGTTIDSLSDIKDVLFTSLANNQVLTYDADNQKWINKTLEFALKDLTDIAIANTVNNQILIYNSTSAKWENKTLSLKDGVFNDINITNPVNNQALVYNSDTSKWENQDIIFNEVAVVNDESEVTDEIEIFIDESLEYGDENIISLNKNDYQQGDITLLSGVQNISSNKATKNGNICFIEFGVNNCSVAGGVTNSFAKIPDFAIPSSNKYIVGMARNNNVFYPIIFTITTDGNIVQSWYGSTATITAAYISASYLIKEG